jgi:hypothetical protein
MLRKFALGVVFVCSAAIGVSQTPVACSNMSVGPNGALNGFVPSPNDAWHQDITNSPIAANSATIITAAADLNSSNLHPDFGSIVGGDYGIPYVVVDSSQTPSVAVPILKYPAESDITLFPVPSPLPVEGSPGMCPTDGNDRHALIIDRNKCVAYELWQAADCTSGWTASDSAVWDFTETEQRPYSYTSADAAGLSVFEGLIRYDEIVAGSINHAIRFTAKFTKDDANDGYFTAPATHAAGTLWGTDNIMGMRIRLKASFDISGFSSTNQIILKAMKQYGMILADNGSNMFFQGTPDARWSDTDLDALKTVSAADFDVIQMGPVYDSATAPKGAVPVITSFTASATTVSSGTSVILTPTVTGASYSYIDNAGFTRGPITVTPTATTTYTLTSRNAYGTTSRALTVTVTGGTAPTLQFAALSTQTFGAAPLAVSSTSNSTGAITYSVVSGPATISGSTVTLTGAGTVMLQASQAAAGTYTAGSAQTSFVVNPGSPALAFVAIPSKTVGAAPFAVSTTTKSSGSIAYSVVSGPATISGNTVTLTGAGTVTLQANEAAAGNYTTAVATTTATVQAAVDYSLSALPSSLSVSRGANATTTIKVTAINSFTGSVSLAASGLPAGVTASFSPASTTSSSTLTLTASSTATVGAATITITGTSGALVHTTTVALTVATTATPDYALSALPSSISIPVSASGSSTIAVADLNGFSGVVSLKISTLPTGVSAVFSPATTSGSSTLTFTAKSYSTVGTVTVTVTGTSGTLVHTTTITLTIAPAPDFSFTVSPSPYSIAQGGSETSTATVTGLNNFSGSLSFEAENLPAGATLSYTPASPTKPGSVTLTALSTAPAGAKTITITGTSGSIVHSIYVVLTVTAKKG